MKVIPQPGKSRSKIVLDAFLAGAPAEAEGTAFFGTIGLEKSVAEAKTGVWYFGDNAYADHLRGSYFRFSRNSFQRLAAREPDYERAKAQGLSVRPWRRSGRCIVIVEQSHHFLELCGAGSDWLSRTVDELREHTDREFRILSWRRDKDKGSQILHSHLEDAFALVTHASVAAVEAIRSGVPVFTTGECAAAEMASGQLSEIESPKFPENRAEWLGCVAASHWTLAELMEGMAWRRLCGDG